MEVTIGLAEFIDKERRHIVAEWETFARSLLPEATGMSGLVLRDHADQILSAIVQDMKTRQSAAEQAEKSKGRGSAQQLGAIGKLHAVLRIQFGFKLGQMVAEYRALRASVLRLWEHGGNDPAGVTRFNESIDEALTEAVVAFTTTTEHFRDQSLGILGHDLRNPLSSVVMGAQLLMESTELTEQNRSTATRMFNSAERMSRMIEDLLDLTRTRFGDLIPIVRAPMDLAPLCKQVVSELEGHRPGQLTLVESGDLRGSWDSDRISQVLSNLVWNAIQHGKKTCPIEVSVIDHGEEVWLGVHNEGPAIPEDVQATLFQPMMRHTKDVQTRSGLGLGLYIASQVVMAHGGTLTVSSSESAGTSFTARLPRRAVILPKG
ncbi:HAMP domain-containing sensor histidine kinase [soil metagenome]